MAHPGFCEEVVPVGVSTEVRRNFRLLRLRFSKRKCLSRESPNCCVVGVVTAMAKENLGVGACTEALPQAESLSALAHQSDLYLNMQTPMFQQ